MCNAHSSGVKQYYSVIPHPGGPAYKLFAAKVKLLLDILSKVAFHQCLVFSNDRRRYVQCRDVLVFSINTHHKGHNN